MANDINSALGALAEGRLSQARKECLRILKKNRRDFDAQHLLGLIELRADKPKLAIRELQKARRIRSDVSSLQNNLGVAHQGIHDHVTAIKHFRKAVSLAPDHVDYLNNLGSALERSGAWQEARGVFTDLIGRMEGAEVVVARLCRIVGEFDEAKEYLKQLPDSAETVVRETALIVELEDGAEASIDYLRSVVSRYPDEVALRRILAKSLQEIGDKSGAIIEYENLLQRIPGDKSTHWELSSLGYFDEVATRQFLEQQPSADLTPGELADWFHFRFRLCDALGDYDQAGSFLVEANRQRSLEHPPNMKREREKFQLVQSSLRENVVTIADDSIRPIFVVGMPRSGTSLVEQLLTSHSQIAGAGEVTVLPTILNHFGFGRRDIMFTNNDLNHIRDSYLSALKVSARGQKFVVDKMPNNFENLGVISEAFPDAVIIHCRRDPVDTCFSCYKQFFTGEMTYMYDQKSLGQYYRLYDRLMDFFSDRFEFKSIVYETLIADFEQEAKRLLDYVGVPWEEQVLKFNENVRFVKTASSQQVRNTIYDTSIKSWQPYEKYLQVLLKELKQV